MFLKTIRQLLEKPVIEKNDADWFAVLPTWTKQYNIRIHSSTKLTPTQTSLKNKEIVCFPKFVTQTKEQKTKISCKGSHSSCSFEDKFSKGDTTNWS